MTPGHALTFAGTTAVVTGAAGGIGSATADLLVAAGLEVVCLDRARGREREDRTWVLADLTDHDAVSSGLDRALNGRGVSYLVNGAGILDESGFAGVPTVRWLQTLDINLLSAYRLVDYVAARATTEDPTVAVVNVSSVEAHRVIALSNPDPNPAYAASKAALAMLTRTAARALAARGTRVNGVSPGFVATAMAAVHGDSGALPPALADRVPAARFGRAIEVANAIIFLLSDQASYITGADLRVDGGFELS